MKSSNTRQSNIELLRCFAMLCIIVYHLCLFALGGVPTGTRLYQALQIPLHIGVPLFVLISGYFGIRFSLLGLMRLCSKGYVYFVPLAVIPMLVTHNYGGAKDLLRSICIIGFDAQWYLNTYLYLFLFSPVINKFLDPVTRVQRIYLLAVLAFMSIYIGNVTEGDVSLVEGKNLTNFLLLYTIGNTIRHCQPRIDSCRMSMLVGSCLLFNLLLVVGFMYVPFLAGKIWKYSYAYDSPIIMVNSIWVFAIFSKIQLQSRFVNWLGSGVFACYLLQCPSVVWKNLFEHPVQQLYTLFPHPCAIIPIMIVYAAIAMLAMASFDKMLNPLWNRLVAFAAKYDEKWNTRQLNPKH